MHIKGSKQKEASHSWKHFKLIVDGGETAILKNLYIVVFSLFKCNSPPRPQPTASFRKY